MINQSINLLKVALVLASLRLSALPDNYRLSQKLSIFAGEMYLMMCVERAIDHFGLGLT